VLGLVGLILIFEDNPYTSNGFSVKFVPSARRRRPARWWGQRAGGRLLGASCGCQRTDPDVRQARMPMPARGRMASIVPDVSQSAAPPDDIHEALYARSGVLRGLP
jgi:hypothetical protein